MNRVYTKVVAVWDGARYCVDHGQSVSFVYEGPWALTCGASSQQKQIEAQQAAYYQQLQQQQSQVFAQAQEVFGKESAIFNELQQTFAPIVAAGPNQQGFSAAELANLNSQVTNDTGAAYNKAAAAVNSQLAAEGGGNVGIVSSSADQIRANLAAAAAAQEGAQRQQIMSANYATGRENFLAATQALGGAPGVFNPAYANTAAGFAGEANNAGGQAAQTANQIAQENNSWVNAAIGALGSIGGAALTGGLSGFGGGGGGTPATMVPMSTGESINIPQGGEGIGGTGGFAPYVPIPGAQF